MYLYCIPSCEIQPREPGLPPKPLVFPTVAGFFFHPSHSPAVAPPCRNHPVKLLNTEVAAQQMLAPCYNFWQLISSSVTRIKKWKALIKLAKGLWRTSQQVAPRSWGAWAASRAPAPQRSENRFIREKDNRGGRADADLIQVSVAEWAVCTQKWFFFLIFFNLIHQPGSKQGLCVSALYSLSVSVCSLLHFFTGDVSLHPLQWTLLLSFPLRILAAFRFPFSFHAWPLCDCLKLLWDSAKQSL